MEVGENEMSVIYADYGNTEKVPFSRILPIPMHLLQIPFQITRSTLTGKAEALSFLLSEIISNKKMHFTPSYTPFAPCPLFLGREHFPAEWPEEVQQMFQTLLLNGVLATVQSFDGSANVLSLTLPTEKGGGNLTAMILDALQDQAKSKSAPSATQKADQTDSSTSNASATVVPDCPQPKLIPEIQKELENITATTGLTVTPEPTPQTLQKTKNNSVMSVNGWSSHNFSVIIYSFLIQLQVFTSYIQLNIQQTQYVLILSQFMVCYFALSA